MPDLAFIIDVPAEIAMERIAKDQERSYKEMFENIEFQEQLRHNFLKIAGYFSGKEKIHILDGNSLADLVFESIKERVDEIL